eukprot:366555-Chlamydomonas_euryale.AAC.9
MVRVAWQPRQPRAAVLLPAAPGPPGLRGRSRPAAAARPTAHGCPTHAARRAAQHVQPECARLLRLHQLRGAPLPPPCPLRVMVAAVATPMMPQLRSALLRFHQRALRWHAAPPRGPLHWARRRRQHPP